MLACPMSAKQYKEVGVTNDNISLFEIFLEYNISIPKN